MGTLFFIGIVILILSMIKVPNKSLEKSSRGRSHGIPKSHPYYKILKRRERARRSNKF